jgi:hypothetical protein
MRRISGAVLPLQDLARLMEAAVALLAARLFLSFTTLPRLAALADWGGSDRRLPPETLTRLVWAVEVSGNLLGGTCLPRALAMNWMLRRRGLSAEVCIGARLVGRPLPAHAWVELDGAVVIGGPVDRNYGLICRLP